jgi:hypothetical protein
MALENDERFALLEARISLAMHIQPQAVRAAVGGDEHSR